MSGEDLQRRVNALELTVARLERQQRSIRRELRTKGELWDTIASPPWRRVLWFLQGYRLWRVGRWYRKTKDLN